MPNPGKFNPDTCERILGAVRAGNYIETAATFAGIHRATLYEWLKRGRAQAKGDYRDFADQLEEALASSEVRDLAIIGKAATEHWQAAAWRLERRYPEKYGRRRVEVTFPKGMGDPTLLSDDELSELKELLKKTQPEA